MARSVEAGLSFGNQESVVENRLEDWDKEGTGVYSIRVVVPGDPNPNASKGFRSLERAFQYFEEIGTKKHVLSKMLIVGYSGAGVRPPRSIGPIGFRRFDVDVDDPLLEGNQAKIVFGSSGAAALLFTVKGRKEVSEENIADLFDKVAEKASQM